MHKYVPLTPYMLSTSCLAYTILTIYSLSYYTLLYNKCVWEAIASVHGEDQTALFARSATAGSQAQPIHWGGDCESTFEAMAGESEKHDRRSRLMFWACRDFAGWPELGLLRVQFLGT
jgi:hypothetical protein